MVSNRRAAMNKGWNLTRPRVIAGFIAALAVCGGVMGWLYWDRQSKYGEWQGIPWWGLTIIALLIPPVLFGVIHLVGKLIKQSK